jgi:hypothetical protein
MFAPEPIPQCVVEFFDRANFLVNRIDQQFRTADLAIIATFALALNAQTQEPAAPEKPKLPDRIDMREEKHETLPAQPDSIAVPVPETPVETQTQAEPGSEGKEFVPAPTGVMDSPAKPSKNFSRGMSEIRMQKMTAAELRAHAKEFYNIECPPTWGKKKMIIAMQVNRPIKPGSQAKRPNEVKKK